MKIPCKRIADDVPVGRDFLIRYTVSEGRRNFAVWKRQHRSCKLLITEDGMLVDPSYPADNINGWLPSVEAIILDTEVAAWEMQLRLGVAPEKIIEKMAAHWTRVTGEQL